MTGDEATSAFAGDPQPVEVYHRGIWYLGELLGWRHGRDGHCLARVRCVVDGLRHSAWKDLGDLRLPEPIGYDEHDGVAAPDDDATRPHVLLADLRTRPRPPAHALVPPPRWNSADPRPAVLAGPPAPAEPAAAEHTAAEPPQPLPAGEAPGTPAPDGTSGNWTHLRRGGRLSRV